MEAGIKCEELSARFFSQREDAALRLLPAETRREAFFACWTRKEAFLKACGGGLSLPLDAFDVSLGEPAQLLGVRGALGVGGPWWIHDCAAGPGYAAAVAGEGPPVRLVRWQWTG
jgi:4'-phosphopantetheinyl transferase